MSKTVKIIVGVSVFFLWVASSYLLILFAIDITLNVLFGVAKYDLPRSAWIFIIVSYFIQLLYTEIFIEVD